MPQVTLLLFHGLWKLTKALGGGESYFIRVTLVGQNEVCPLSNCVGIAETISFYAFSETSVQGIWIPLHAHLDVKTDSTTCSVVIAVSLKTKRMRYAASSLSSALLWKWAWANLFFIRTNSGYAGVRYVFRIPNVLKASWNKMQNVLDLLVFWGTSNHSLHYWWQLPNFSVHVIL